MKVSFFAAVIYGVVFHKSNGEITDQNKSIEVLREDFYNELLHIRHKIKLDRALFGYYDR